MDAVFYWEMTYGEIIAAVEGKQRALKAEAQLKASLVYQLGNLVGLGFHEPKKYPSSLKKAFPGLFEDADDSPKQQNWQIMKERINAYNDYLKRKRGEKA